MLKVKVLFTLTILILFSSQVWGQEAERELDNENPYYDDADPYYDDYSDDSSQKSEKSMAPGFSGSIVQQFNSDSVYGGGGLHYTMFQFVGDAQSNGNFGGYYELFLEFGFYKDITENDLTDIFFTAAYGFNYSIEKFRSYSRSFLIPYIGVKMGYIYFNEPEAGGFFVEPLAGLLLFDNEYIALKYDCGLLLNTVDLNRYLGLQNNISISLNL